MKLQAAYFDLDGTLLGRRGSILHDGDGVFTTAGIRAMEACARAEVEVVIVSGRRLASLQHDARLLGVQSFAAEAGALLVVGGEHIHLTGSYQPTEDASVYEQIDATGAPQLLLDHFGGRLKVHEDALHERAISHVFFGEADAGEANDQLRGAGLGELRLLDNGPAEEGGHIFHLMPDEASKANAVVTHRRIRGYDADACIAVGDSEEDAGMAAAVGTFWFVGNGAWTGGSNIRRAEGTHGAGVYEAVVTELAERR